MMGSNDVLINNEPKNKWDWGIKIITNVKWYVRLWFLISNPFLYIFKGKYRF